MDYEKIKTAILAAQAVTDRLEVQHCTETLLKGNDGLGGLAALVQTLGRLRDAWTLAANDPVIAEAYECAHDDVLHRIGDECVRIVMGDAAEDAADLAAGILTQDV